MPRQKPRGRTPARRAPPPAPASRRLEVWGVGNCRLRADNLATAVNSGSPGRATSIRAKSATLAAGASCAALLVRFISICLGASSFAQMRCPAVRRQLRHWRHERHRLGQYRANPAASCWLARVILRQPCVTSRGLRHRLPSQSASLCDCLHWPTLTDARVTQMTRIPGHQMAAASNGPAVG